MRDPKHPRQFTGEFRRQMVALVDSGKPRAEVMRGHDLESESESTPIPFTPLRRHLDGALHIPRLELRGAEIAQSRVDPDPVVEALYVLEDLERRLLARLEGPRVHALRLDEAHER